MSETKGSITVCSEPSSHSRNGGAAYTDGMPDRKEFCTNEGAEIYGNVEEVEKYGYVARGMKSRHIQFIALGGSIGTGIFLGIGIGLTQAGPLSLLLGYVIMGFAVFGLMQSLGEMATWLPLPGAIPQFCARYADDALGFAIGWNNWYSAATTLCSEISAAAIIIGFWNDQINPAVWISIITFVVIALNIYAVRIYGEAEFWFASIKIIAIVGLLLLTLVIDLGGGPSHDRLGFRYWVHPGAMNEYLAVGDTGRFLGFLSTLINATFSYGGVETVAVTAGEVENPRKNIPKAVRRVFWRILIFYVFGCLAVGVLVPYNNQRLLNAQASGVQNAAASPWVIGIQNAGIIALPSIINVVVLTAATSSVSAFLYVGSRYLYALAQDKHAPKFLLKCSKKGIPYWCVGITASFSLLAYMSVSTASNRVFFWFYNLTTISGLITWVGVCIAYLKFYDALKAQGIDRNSLPFKSPWQPYLAWFSLIFFILTILVNGFAVFIHGHWDTSNFLVAYIGVPIILAFYFFWKLLKHTKWRKGADIDLQTGRVNVEAQHWPEKEPGNAVERIWSWIA